MIDWLIIGGGIHGTHLSLYLTQRRTVSHDRIRVLDPHPEPLTLWRQFTANTGMEFLRSPHAHNLHYDPFSLVTFARTRNGEPLARFIEPYGRPALTLFNTHSETLIERYKLRDMRLLGRAQNLTRLADGWRVETETGGIEARRVVISIGSTEQPAWPDWAVALRASGAPVHHIFEPNFNLSAFSGWENALVVGGGITAAQTAMTLALRTPGHVNLLMRHPARVYSFDADTGWVTPIYLKDFHREQDYTRRRAMIKEARHRGSMPPDVAAELGRAVQNNLLEQHTGQVRTATFNPDGRITVHLEDGSSLNTDQLILATGFETKRPGGAWLGAAIANYGLPTAPDGYPIVDQTLCWSPGLYVMGSLAELEVGPVSRNFIGARLASDRIGGAS